MSRCLNLPCDCLRSKEKKFDPAPSVLFFPLDLRISSLFRSSTGQPGLTHFSEIPLVFVFSHASRHDLWTCRELTVFPDSLPRLDDLTAPRILQHVCTLHMALALVSDSQFIRKVRGQALYSGSPQQTGVLSHSLRHRFLMDCVVVVSLTPRVSAGQPPITNFDFRCAENDLPISYLTLLLSTAGSSPTRPAVNSAAASRGPFGRRANFSLVAGFFSY
ncbi:hypothetical protein B0H10DRAFT_335023 [Mycena sp. CBHHK59/15]|nr:hypothetical protein B0H10DRAFT_335023 [Mycena sp. CBHHK59/15]